MGAVGIVAIAIGMFTLVANFFSSIQNAHNLVEQRINKLEEEIDNYDLPGMKENIHTLMKDNSEPATQMQSPEVEDSEDQR